MKRGFGDERPCRRDRRIEALGVPDGQDDAGARGRARSDRRPPRATAPSASRPAPARRREKRHGDVAVQLGRHGDGHGIDPAEEIARVEERLGPVRRGNLLRPCAVRVDHRDERHARQCGARIRA